MKGFRHFINDVRHKRFTIADFFIIMLLIAISLIALLPFIHVLMTSLSDATKLRSGFRILPNSFTLDSYKDAFTSPNMMTGLKNSVLRVLIATPLTVIINSMAAYATSKDDMPGAKALRLFFVLTMYLHTGMIADFLTMKAYGLNGTFWIYIVGVITPFFMILMRNYMSGIPQTLEDAALLDGADYWTYYIRVLIPVSKPIIATVVLFTFVNNWNAYTDTLIYNLTKPENYTLQYVLYLALSSAKISIGLDGGSFKEFSSVSITTLRCALTVVTLLPVCIIYPFLQKFIVSGVTLGSVKE